MIVLDTHVFLWYVLADPAFPVGFRARLERQPETVYVPTICLWEAMMLVERGRISLGPGKPATKLLGYLADCGFAEAALTSEIAMLSRTLAFSHEDPADRFIAATAYSLRADLATSDRRLRQLPWVKLAY